MHDLKQQLDPEKKKGGRTGAAGNDGGQMLRGGGRWEKEPSGSAAHTRRSGVKEQTPYKPLEMSYLILEQFTLQALSFILM